MISIKNVNVVLNDKLILEDINLDLSEKKIGIIGLNGCGKTTFSRLLNGLQLSSSGAVTINGLDTKKDIKKIRNKVGFIFQNPDYQIIFPIVDEDIAFGLKNLSYSKEEINILIEDILKLYDLSDFRYSLTNSLSGGQKQLLAILSVLVMKPEYIILDEPTTLLDLINKQKIFTLLENIKQTIIVVTHDLDMLSNFDRVICFDKGKVKYDGLPDITINNYKNYVSNMIKNDK